MILNIPFKIKCWEDGNDIYNIYCKEYEISAYGKTKAHAEKMFKDKVYFLLEQTMPTQLIDNKHPQY